MVVGGRGFEHWIAASTVCMESCKCEAGPWVWISNVVSVICFSKSACLF